jgi:sec-independent protein translocase protein TatC
MATTDVERELGTSFDEPDEDGDGDSRQMTLIEHLEELRSRLFVCVIAVVVAGVAAFIFNDPLIRLLLLPLPHEANALMQHGSTKLVITGVGEGFSVTLKLSIAVGIALAAPVWLYELWAFIAPALTHREAKYAKPFTIIGALLFIAGISVGFITLRYPITWLIDFGNNNFVDLITADNYFSFVAYFLLAFGMVFELPLVITFLSLIGVVSSRMLAKNRMYILFGLWVLSCFVTPGADPYSPIIIGAAFTVLFFLSEILIRAIGK